MTSNTSGQNFIFGKLRNRLGAAEGAVLPPPQAGATRVPVVTGLQLKSSTLSPQGSKYVLSWLDAPTGVAVDHYNIVMTNYPGAPNNAQVVAASPVSPVTVTLALPASVAVNLTVQTALANGFVSPLPLSPSVAVASQATTSTTLGGSPLATSNLSDYATGVWTPADNSAAALSLTTAGAVYVKIGNLVTVTATITYPATASAATAGITGLPFGITSGATNRFIGLFHAHTSFIGDGVTLNSNGTTSFQMYKSDLTSVTNAMLSTLTCFVSLTYSVA